MTCVWELLKKKKEGGARDSWKQNGKISTTVEPEQKVYMGYIILPIFASVYNFP